MTLFDRSIEASASHEAMRNEQVARGQLERQKLLNEMDAEKEKTKLLELQAITAAVESTGQAKAESQAQAEKMLIECESEIACRSFLMSFGLLAPKDLRLFCLPILYTMSIADEGYSINVSLTLN